MGLFNCHLVNDCNVVILTSTSLTFISCQQESIVWKYIDQFKDPLILMLFFSALLSVLVGQYEDALSIAMAVFIVGTVAFIQEYQSEKSLEALKTLVPPRCNVIRSGQTSNILADSLVPGDIISLSSGDRIPADARLISCADLSVDESALTGEPEPRMKTSNALPNVSDDSGITEQLNIVYLGSLVCSGNARAIVIATGVQTEFGKTYQDMKDVEAKRTPLQVKMDELGQKLSVFSIGVIICIGLLGILQGKDFLTTFNIGVSLAVAAIPEGLPICVTVTLALGVMRMAGKNAIVKKLPGVEALGCANFICSDKTGTLTENRMTVIQVYCPAMDDVATIANSSVFSASRNSSQISLKIEDTESSKISDESIFSGRIAPNRLGGALSYQNQPIDGKKLPCLHQLFDIASLCNNAHVSNSSVIGLPVDGALLIAAANLSISDRRETLKRLNETPFSSDRKYMEVQYADNGQSSFSSGMPFNVSSRQNDANSSLFPSRDNAMINHINGLSNPSEPKKLLCIKGALEVVLPMCISFMNSSGDIVPLSSVAVDRVMQHSIEMSYQGLRVIAVACGSVSNQCILCGIVGLMDPIRDGVPEAVRRIKATGTHVVMITGDAQMTAISIAKSAGIYDGSGRVLSGIEIDELTRGGDEALRSVIESVSVCYRTSPRHKLAIVRALQALGNVVAMTGMSYNIAVESLSTFDFIEAKFEVNKYLDLLI